MTDGPFYRHHMSIEILAQRWFAYLTFAVLTAGAARLFLPRSVRAWPLVGYFLSSALALLTLVGPVQSDEKLYLVVGTAVASGDYLPPLVDDVRSTDAGYKWVIGGVYRLFGPDPGVGRLFNSFTGAMLLMSLYHLARTVFDSRRAASLALLGGVFYPESIVRASVQSKDVFLVLLSVTSFVVLFSSLSFWKRAPLWIGLVVAVILIRFPLGVVLVLLGGVAALASWRGTRRWQTVLPIASSAAVGMLTLLVLTPAWWIPTVQLVISVGAGLGLAVPDLSPVDSSLTSPFTSFTSDNEVVLSKVESAYSLIALVFKRWNLPVSIQSLILFPYNLFTPIPLWFLRDPSWFGLWSSLAGLVWYAFLPFAFLGMLGSLANWRAEPLMLLIFIALLALSDPLIFFGWEPLRQRFQIVPYVILFSAAGFERWRAGDETTRRWARVVIPSLLAAYALILGAYSFLALRGGPSL